MNRRPTRYVPVTRNGRTHYVPGDAPRLPRDWDHAVLTAVTIATSALVAVSVAWSTASIGDLLANTVTPVLAYGAASAFDLLWIISMAVEWLARYDSGRARLPRVAGHISLGIAMGAVGIHGWLNGNWATAAIGAFVSALAKGGWTVVMHHQAVQLDRDTAAWLHAERAARGAARALAAEERTDARAAGQLAAIRDHLVLPDPDSARTDPDADPDESGQGPDDPDQDEPLTLAGPRTVKDAIRTAADSGITDPDAVLRYVRTVADANAKPETVARYTRALRKEA